MLPYKTASPPSSENAFSIVLITSLFKFSAPLIVSPNVLPVTVGLSRLRRSLLNESSLKIAEIPPAFKTSSMCTFGVAGLTLQI